MRGRTGLQVTTLGYGAMELRGAPRARDISEAQAETILNKVVDAGINYQMVKSKFWRTSAGNRHHSIAVDCCASFVCGHVKEIRSSNSAEHLAKPLWREQALRMFKGPLAKET